MITFPSKQNGIEHGNSKRENKPATADIPSDIISRSSSCWLQRKKILMEKHKQCIKVLIEDLLNQQTSNEWTVHNFNYTYFTLN